VRPWRLLTAGKVLAVDSQSANFVASHLADARTDAPDAVAADAGLGTAATKVWNQLNWQDCAMGSCLTWVVIYIWDYTLKNL